MKLNIFNYLMNAATALNRELCTITNCDTNEHITYYDLLLLANQFGDRCINAGVKERDIILIQGTNPLSIITAFWGCVSKNLIPALFPVTGQLNSQVSNLSMILMKYQIRYIAVESGMATTLGRYLLSNTDCKDIHIIPITCSVTLDNTKITFNSDVSNLTSDEDVAIIQFSSGSTGNPKGICLTHRNIVSDVLSISERIQLSYNDNVFNWLPLSHDFGLIVMHLCSTFRGCNQFLLSPTSFLRKPAIWASVISNYKITITAMPNFAFKLILKSYIKTEYLGVDLSTVRAIATAGEPISCQLVDSFINVFKENKLGNNVITPAYGLAEATVAVTCSDYYSPTNCLGVNTSIKIGDLVKYSKNGSQIMSCGYPLSCNKLMIVDNNGEKVDEDIVGHVLVAGDNIMKGYYLDKEIIRGSWLRTGDVGFIHKGELYITGREKEMIIINGQNIFLPDIERVVVDQLSKSDITMPLSLSVFTCWCNEEENESICVAMECNDYILPNKTELEVKIREIIYKFYHIKVKEIMYMNQLPKTASGKTQYFALQNAYSSFVELRELITKLIKQELVGSSLTEEDIHKTPFSELGISSIQMEQLFAQIEANTGVNMTIDIIWNYPTIDALSKYLFEIKQNDVSKQPLAECLEEEIIQETDVAIISTACHLPGNVNNAVQLWEALKTGKVCYGLPSEKRVNLPGGEMMKNYIAGYVNDIFDFSPKFNISPNESALMDPQQKMLLRSVDEAIENAGLKKSDIDNTNTGVFIGIASHDYSHLNVVTSQNIHGVLGNSSSIAANRISYLYNLKGPSIAVDTACSSSMVAICMAYKSLINKECDMAICGGVNLILNEALNTVFEQAGMTSKVGKCQVFDKDADGYIRGEGCGILVLKRAKDVTSNKILALIKGCAINQDGKSNGITAPNGIAQQNVIKEALANSGLSINDIDYVEAHGTGTKLGDPIEVNALNEVFKNRKREYPCLVGSVKANIGHLEAASGVASVIKAILILNYNTVPYAVNLNSVNAYINIDKDKLNISTKDNVDNVSHLINNIGISSFGFGGTNCHLILSSKKRNEALIEKQCNFCEVSNDFPSIIKSETIINDNKPKEDINICHSGGDWTIEVNRIISDVTGYPISSISEDSYLQEDLGIDSIMLLDIVDAFNKEFKVDESTTAKIVEDCSANYFKISDLKEVIKKYCNEDLLQVQIDDDEKKEDNIVVVPQCSIEDFDEYRTIKSQMKQYKYNPYYKLNLGKAVAEIDTPDGKKINYSTYNYIGLNGSKQIAEDVMSAILQYGTSVSGSRMISGEIPLHRELENEISEFLGTEDTIVYIGGYTTNVGAISTFAGSRDVIVYDSLAHNSIITGCILSGAKRIAFKHNDPESLNSILKQIRPLYRRILIVVEGIYSMDGDICKLADIIHVKKQYGAFIMVDEAHSLGVIGNCGRGIGDYCGVKRTDVDLWMGTMSKSLASCGGYISGKKEIVELLKYTSNSFIFSVGISPSNAMAAISALRIMKKTPELQNRLLENSNYFLQKAKEAGINTGLSCGTAIVPCILGDSNKCMIVSHLLYERGINVMPIIHPAVPENEARLRFFISSLHTKEQISHTIKVLSDVLSYVKDYKY